VADATAEEPCVCRRFASDIFVRSVRHCELHAVERSNPCRSFAGTALPPALAGGSSAWTTGIGVRRTPFCERLCPVVTSQRPWLAMARALRCAARTRLLGLQRFPDAVQRETVHRRSGIVKHSGVCEGPGSAAHHFMLRCARDTVPFSQSDSIRRWWKASGTHTMISEFQSG